MTSFFNRTRIPTEVWMEDMKATKSHRLFSQCQAKHEGMMFRRCVVVTTLKHVSTPARLFVFQGEWPQSRDDPIQSEYIQKSLGIPDGQDPWSCDQHIPHLFPPRRILQCGQHRRGIEGWNQLMLGRFPVLIPRLRARKRDSYV